MDIRAGLAHIRTWINAPPDIATFHTNADFMRYIVPFMQRILFLLQAVADSAPNEEGTRRGVLRRRAIIVGHLVRLTKLYQGALMHIAANQAELAAMFLRPLVETAVRAEYLMQGRKGSVRSFILTSYKAEKEILHDLASKAAQRPLSQIERRIKRKISARLRLDKISVTQLLNNRIWNIDGKDFRQLLRAVGKEAFYPYAFGSGSAWLHGNWYDISIHHLVRRGRYYFPALEYDEVDPRLSSPLNVISLQTAARFLEWHGSDPDGYIRGIIKSFLEVDRGIDVAHEASLGS